MRIGIFYLSVFSLVFWLVGCGIQANLARPAAQAGSTPAQTTVTVFAAASLTESFSEMAANFETEHPDANLLLNFAGSNALRLQIEQGAPADLFASANTTQMDELVQANLVNQPVIFAHNQLVVIVPAANPAAIETLADLAQPGLKLVLDL